MTEVDLLERGPRLRRFVISLLVAIGVAVVVALVALRHIEDPKPGDWRWGSWRAIGLFTALGAVVGYAGAYAFLFRRDRRRR